MQENIATLKEIVADRTYTLLCPVGSTWGELHDILHKMKQHVIDQINAINAAEQPPPPKTEEYIEV